MLNFSFSNPFAGRPKLSLGLDIGSHAVKVCELTETADGYTLLSLGSTLMPTGAVEDGVLVNPEAVAQVINKLLTNLKIKGRKAAISISGYSVIVKKISLTAMSDAEMESHIHSEAEQYIPFDIDEVYLDFQNLQTNSTDNDRTDVMLVAAKKEVIDTYLATLEKAGLAAGVVDVDAFALENSYEDNFGLDDNVALVDIGASKMNINIILHGTSILARDAAVGSRQLTEQIQSRLEVDFDQAEALKIGKECDEEQEEALQEIFMTACQSWVHEIQRALDFFSTNHPDEKISKIVLSGGGSRVKGFDRLVTNETGLEASLFNPFTNISNRADKIDPEYLRYLAPEMAIAVGLASRPVEV